MHSIQRRISYLRGIRMLKTHAPLVAAVISFNCSSSPPQPQEAVLIPYHDSAGIAGAATFGVGASSSFQNGWQADLTYAWNDAWGFWDQGNHNMNGLWAYNLSGGQGWWEQPSGYHDNVNSVDFFFAETHGSAWTNPYEGAYFMWDQYYVAHTTLMRLDRAMGFFTYSCHTHVNDGGIWDRWSPVFQGGLRIATGSWNLLTDGPVTDDTGSNFAAYFEGGEQLAPAWENAVYSEWETSQAPSTMASGVSFNDCSSRLYGMTAYNIHTYPKLQDQVVGLCWYQVQD
jgi:hypothetical protein